MSPDTVETFEASLAGIDVERTRTTPEGFADAMRRLVEEPAIGTPLDIDGVDLDETPVKTDLTPRDLVEAATGVTPVRYAIAEYGSFVVESNAAGNEPVALYPPTHVGVVRESDILDDVGEAISRLGERFSDGESAVFATGPSSTGDMGALVKGVHGPKTVHAVVLEGL